MQFNLETERLLLRELRMEDAAAMFEMDSDPEVHRYLGNKPVTTINEVRCVIEFVRQQYIDHGIGRWAVIEKETGEFAGWSGLKFMTDDFNGRTHFYDLGYRFRKKYWGRGYATETAKASLRYGFINMNLGEICGMAHVENSASNQVLQKIGMRRTGTFLLDEVEHYFYEISREEWLSKQSGDKTMIHIGRGK